MINENLKSLRKINQYTQEELAEKLNVSRQSIAKW
ncbi:TPA: helix-turn-helix transcriptional regulator, partial [Clostridioides difficile]|nr:helix-turn-helix transcriptional regulator [Clostridioides difficile]HBG0231588.1 helix-turn-helix transcriptional regulator [Clostridioides difficile]HBG2991547.1 helix-turn-helix transcriptional regulator [Clostridioides difficile]HBG4081038.1 helix-turn-helix transcriptional regulator [Clostridioides difficile]HBG4119440.1 helix-turn-helix transcriptional regulator [Clostridioides difficile]